jgi:hypothetical protein
MGSLAVKMFISYVERNPQVIEELIGLLIQAIIADLKKAKHDV